MTVSSFDVEDWLLFAGMTDDGLAVDPEQCQRLFSLTATESGSAEIIDENTHSLLQGQLGQQRQAIIAKLSQKNAEFFELEMTKLESWAGDLKNSLEHELREIDRDIKDTKREAQLAPNLEAKVALHKRIKELESRRSEKRRGLFEAQDAVDTRKDGLLNEVETRMKQSTSSAEVFVVRWSIE